MKSRWILALAVPAAFAVGYLLRGGPSHDAGDPRPSAAAEEAAEYTCSMHPQIRQPAPGLCPLCAMDLIPVITDAGADVGPREISMSPAALRLARVETVRVERRTPTGEIRMTGKLFYDETRLLDVSLLSEGQVRRLFINFTGAPVRKGDRLAEIYSPDVFAASRELVLATHAPGSESVAQAARRKLLLLGMDHAQVEEILASGEATETYLLHSPITGVALSLAVKEGGWLQRGGRLATLVDPSVLWAHIDAYERDTPHLHQGQQVDLAAEAFPGRAFSGSIDFIAPEMNDATRTLPVRLTVPNPDGRLKPGMFVRARLDTTYPEEERGSAQNQAGEEPLLIPASAPLMTGTRAVVYVAAPEREGVYEGRVIELGPRFGDFYVVLDGLAEGEAVVVQGNLQIDSAMQILAKPSMMNPEGGGSSPGHAHGHAQSHAPADAEPVGHAAPRSLEIPADVAAKLLDAYLDVQAALATDDLDTAKTPLRAMMEVTGHLGALPDLMHEMLAAATLDAMRRPHFETLSNAMIAAVRNDPTVFEKPLFLMNCPMVHDDRGADWLQRTDTLANPYFGATMLRCGTVEEEWK